MRRIHQIQRLHDNLSSHLVAAISMRICDKMHQPFLLSSTSIACLHVKWMSMQHWTYDSRFCDSIAIISCDSLASWIFSVSVLHNIIGTFSIHDCYGISAFISKLLITFRNILPCDSASFHFGLSHDWIFLLWCVVSLGIYFTKWSHNSSRKKSRSLRRILC